METEPAAVSRLLLMARKLFRFMTVIAVPALACGLWLLLVAGIGHGQGWMHVKLGIVVLIILYHVYCGFLLRTFERGENKRSDKWYRMFNELPVLGLLGATLLVVLKPFKNRNAGHWAGFFLSAFPPQTPAASRFPPPPPESMRPEPLCAGIPAVSN